MQHLRRFLLYKYTSYTKSVYNWLFLVFVSIFSWCWVEAQITSCTPTDTRPVRQMRGRRLSSLHGLQRSATSITTDTQNGQTYKQYQCCDTQTKAAVILNFVLYKTLPAWIFAVLVLFIPFNFYTYFHIVFVFL